MKTITHYQMNAGNCDLFAVTKCKECGKEIQECINTVFGKSYENKALANGWKVLPPRAADELCYGDCA